MTPTRKLFSCGAATLLAATILSCSKQPESGGAAAPEPAATAAEPAGAAPAESADSGEDVPWAQKTPEQRGKYMAAVVEPRMKGLFQTFDSQEFANFGCKTCHGDNAMDVSFKMPNKLVALPKEKTMEHAMEHDPKAAKFMAETVVPTMAKLLGEEAAAPGSEHGFQCFECHQAE